MLPYKDIIGDKMKKKLYIAFFLIVLLSLAVFAARVAKEQKTIDLTKNIRSNKAKARDVHPTRQIADTVTIKDKQDFKAKGCKIVRELSDSTVIDCPKGLRLKNARPERIFHIVDMDSNAQISADLVWQLQDSNGELVTGKTTKVAVLDTGIDYNHPELALSYAGGYDFINNDNDPMDDDGHGTHVSGTIAALGNPASFAKGVAPDVELIMGRVCASNGCPEGAILAGIEWAVNQGADVISMSLSGGNFDGVCDDDSLAQKVNWAFANGVVSAIASGNEDSGVGSPACASSAIAVGAVNISDSRASFSNYGSALDVVAPGVDIYSAYPCYLVPRRISLDYGCGPKPCNCIWYARMSGTSMAAPHVAGEIALVKQMHPEWSASEIKEAVEQGADDMGTAGYDIYYGWGRINALNSVGYSFSCEENASRLCSLQEGVCAGAAQTCLSNVWSTCDYFTYSSDYEPSETSCDGIDNDCDGNIDEGLTNLYYSDNDNDNFGAGSSVEACTQPIGFVDNDLDCNDNDGAINPDSEEICDDGIDNDCDGDIDEGCGNSFCGDGICSSDEDCFICSDDCLCIGKNCKNACCGDGTLQKLDNKYCTEI